MCYNEVKRGIKDGVFDIYDYIVHMDCFADVLGFILSRGHRSTD